MLMFYVSHLETTVIQIRPSGHSFSLSGQGFKFHDLL